MGWLEKNLYKQKGRGRNLELGHQAVMLQDAQQVMQLSRDKARDLAINGLHGVSNRGESVVPKEEPDLGDIHVGDTVQNYYGATTPAAPATSSTPLAPTPTDTTAATPAAVSNAPSTLSKILPGAAIALVAAGGGAGTMAALSALNKPVPAVVAPVQPGPVQPADLPPGMDLQFGNPLPAKSP